MAGKKGTQNDSRQKELQELIELKKMQQAAAEHKGEEPIFEKEEKIVPRTFREKWANYWYHYKGATWITVFVVILAVWFIKDIFFGPQYDLTVTSASKFSFSAINPDINALLDEYITEDYNGDGKMNTIYSEITVDYTGDTIDPQVNMLNMQKFMAVFTSGTDLVFIMDQGTYDSITENSTDEIFTDFSEVYAGMDMEIVQGDKIILNNTRFGKELYMGNLGEDIFLCVRSMVGTADPGKEKVQKAYEASMQFADNLLREEYPELFAD